MSKAKSAYLEGNFAPWRCEDTITHLEIEGNIPRDLQGVLLRNGPNPQFDPEGQYHWFDGDGMLHAIRISEGYASYDNRWVRTERFLLENKMGQSLFNSNLVPQEVKETVKVTSRNTANTNIVAYNRQLLALNEGAQPVSIQLSNLQTLGDYTFNGQITRRLSAHPRYDYQRKELMTYSYIDEDGQLMYYRLNRDNKIVNQQSIDWPYMAMMHDFINTENYVIFPIFPCTLSFQRMREGQGLFMWEGDILPSVFIVTDKQGKEVTRIETDPCYVFHFGNAYEQGNEIIIDAMVADTVGLMPDRHGNIPQRGDRDIRLGRWRIDPSKGSLSLEYLDELASEFPRFDERFNGQPYQHLYCGVRPDAAALFDRISHYDLHSGKRYDHLFGDDIPSEPVFVANGHQEGQGYLLTVVYRQAQDRSDVVILNAQQVDDEPLAIIKIPHRIPFGFHGNFVER